MIQNVWKMIKEKQSEEASADLMLVLLQVWYQVCNLLIIILYPDI